MPATQVPTNRESGAWRSMLRRVSTIGHDDGDDSALRTQKTTLVLVTVIALIAVVPWGIFYISYGLIVAGMIPIVYAALSVFGIAQLSRTKDDRFLRYQQVVFILVLPVLVHIALGGFATSSGVMMYSIMGILGAMSYADMGRPGVWFAGYAVLVLAMVPLDSTFRAWAPDLPVGFVNTFFAVNIVTVALLVVLVMLVYVRARDSLATELALERERSDRLLLNVLPASIAERLKDGEQPIADRFDTVAVLFADIVDFTPLSESLSAAELVEGLNRVFSKFDELTLEFGAEKVKTIGDAYMVISGAPVAGADIDALGELALRMRDAAATLSIGDRSGIKMRFGMDIGPAVAGVIGESKFVYDVYGITVNMASRMESRGVPDRIQVTERAAAQLRDRFEVSERGPVDIKGVGTVRTFFLDDVRSQRSCQLTP